MKGYLNMEEYRSNMNILKEVLRGKRPHDDVEFVVWLKESEEHQKCYEGLYYKQRAI